jgi:hypothetical protein
MIWPYEFADFLGMTKGKYFWLGLIVVLIGGCQPDARDGHEAAFYEAPSLDQVQAGLLSHDTTSLLPDSVLASLLPSVFPPYESKQEESTSFLGKQLGFSRARAVYLMENQHYLAAELSDYAHDAQAFLHLYDQFVRIPQSTPPVINALQVPAPYPDVFLWHWQDAQTEVHYLEAGIFFRFHLRLSTDRPIGKLALEDAFKRLDWSFLRQLPQEN